MQALQRLGAAALLQWNGLPTHAKRQLFVSSTSALLKRATEEHQIARYLRKHKANDTTAQ